MRLASEADFLPVRAFYNRLIEDMEKLPYHPMWDKEGHPSNEYLHRALDAGELWVAETTSELAGAMIVNHSANEGYNGVPWQVQASPEHVVIVHAFGVSMRHQGKGLGSAMMREIIERSRAAGDKAMRLDLIDFNRPTEKIYLKLGFVKCAAVKLYYEEVGWQLFHMFELAL